MTSGAVVVVVETAGGTDEGVERDVVVVVWAPCGVGETSDGVVVVEEEVRPPMTDSPSSESSLSYSTASLP